MLRDRQQHPGCNRSPMLLRRGHVAMPCKVLWGGNLGNKEAIREETTSE